MRWEHVAGISRNSALNVGHDVAVDQGGEVWHADEGKRGLHIAAQHRSFMHFRPGLHLPFDLEGIDIDQAGRVVTVPDPLELEGPDAALAHMANRPASSRASRAATSWGARPRMGLPLGMIQRPPPLEVTRQTSTSPFGVIKNGSAAIWCKALFRFLRLRTY